MKEQRPKGQKLKYAAAIKELTVGVTSALAEHGFASSRVGKQPVFSRRQGDASCSFFLVQMSSGSARPFVAIELAAVATELRGLVDEHLLAWPLGEPAVICAGVAELYRDPDGKIRTAGRVHARVGEYAVCHASCLAAALEDLPQDFEEYVLPLFDRLGSVAAADAFYHDDPASILRRYANGWLEHAFVGITLAALMRRADFAAWRDHYRALVATPASLNPRAEVSLAAFDALTAALPAR
ncbi:MAG: hypothetical protein IT371_16600 [Deltaproteobacteria bacterium]|nr:hypothetical protein [Deltaproteobacteria bacterium]